jgi:predicted Zn-dependent protease
MKVKQAAAPMQNFLSAADCAALMQRVVGFAQGGGETRMGLDSTWTGNVRWARNRISSGGDVRSNDIILWRSINGAGGTVRVNTIDDASLEHAVRRAEHIRLLQKERLESDLHDDYQEPISHPKIWFDTTYHLDAGQRAAIVRAVIEPIERAGMLSAGYLEVKATGRSLQSTRSAQQPLYYPWTSAQFSLTVRDSKGTGSGWAGVNWNDWSRIDTSHLAQVALDKCLHSRNPVAVEPGRYTTILEPQAVGDLMGQIFSRYTSLMFRWSAEQGDGAFAGLRSPQTKIGQQVLDDRITITADPMDPDLGFPPFDLSGWVYHPITWVERGVLKLLGYNRDYAMKKLHLNSGLLNSGAFHMTGGTTSIDEMIQTTKRGLLVTRFSGVQQIDADSALCTGYTRDGLWLIENGKISKAVKNFRFTESPLFVFNQVEQLGVPQRIFHPTAPIVVPSAKVRDFSFTSLADAV